MVCCKTAINLWAAFKKKNPEHVLSILCVVQITSQILTLEIQLWKVFKWQNLTWVTWNHFYLVYPQSETDLWDLSQIYWKICLGVTCREPCWSALKIMYIYASTTSALMGKSSCVSDHPACFCRSFVSWMAIGSQSNVTLGPHFFFCILMINICNGHSSQNDEKGVEAWRGGVTFS